jgi:hypothetical protein
LNLLKLVLGILGVVRLQEIAAGNARNKHKSPLVLGLPV